jgi:hypothetical protein
MCHAEQRLAVALLVLNPTTLTERWRTLASFMLRFLV